MTVIAVVARVAVGLLWAAEAFVKYKSGFGAADVLLVSNGAAMNSRTPFWFDPLGAVMGAIPAAMGVVVPLTEAALAVLLTLGVATRWVAFVSIGLLMTYWGADQLIAQYPAMVVLSALVLLIPASDRCSIDTRLQARRGRRPA